MDSHYGNMYVERDIHEDFDLRDGGYPLVAVVGPRQSGKTTFLMERMKGRDARYVLFDDDDVMRSFISDVKGFEFHYLEGKELGVLDEVQDAEDAGRKLKYLVDSGRKLWITGSSEVILGKEVLSHLVGRASVLRLYPFSFQEFARARGMDRSDEVISKRLMREHMAYGGYPAVVMDSDQEMKRTRLRYLLDILVFRDISRTFSIPDSKGLERLIRYLAVNSGGMLSFETACKVTGLTYPTLMKYLDALEMSYIIQRITPFFSNKNKELSRRPKVYFVDPGIRNTVLGHHPQEPDGAAFENYVFQEILRKGVRPRFWRTKSKAEVDFILESGVTPIPVEVKLSNHDNSLTGSFRSFLDSYEPKEAFVVHFDGKDRTMERNGCNIHFLSLPGFMDSVDWKALHHL